METVIAFANEPGLRGGWLLLGVERRINDKGDTEYWPEGVPDPDKAQKDLATQCASMLNVSLRPEISVERIDGKTLIVSMCRGGCPPETHLREGHRPAARRLSAHRFHRPALH
jgi:predicted HTH transcriptional regulator